MAHIVDFRSTVRRPNARSARSGAGSAEIVIFPGVRYERWSNGPSATQAVAFRDRIELPD
ncbi:MAG: hypothetical protein ACK4MF_06945 [Hyphomicrobiaceae bacterium]